MNPRLILPVLLLLVSPASAGAESKRWVSANLSGATYAMTALNADISRINSAIAGSGLSMNRVTKGLGLGVVAGADLGHRLTVGLGYDRLFAHSKVADASTSVQFDVPANFVRALGRYAFRTDNQHDEFVEISLGRASTAGTASVSGPDIGPRNTGLGGSLKNSCFAYELGLGGREWTTSRYAITGNFGYRHARSGGAHRIDYSGLFLRAGVTMALTP